MNAKPPLALFQTAAKATRIQFQPHIKVWVIYTRSQFAPQKWEVEPVAVVRDEKLNLFQILYKVMQARTVHVGLDFVFP